MTKSRTHKHTLIIFKSYCFSMVTMVTRSRFDVTLYVRCLPSFGRAKLLKHEQNVPPDTVNTTSLCNYHAQNRNQNTLAHTSTNCDLSEARSTYSVQLHCCSQKSEAAYMEYTKKKSTTNYSRHRPVSSANHQNLGQSLFKIQSTQVLQKSTQN